MRLELIPLPYYQHWPRRALLASRLGLCCGLVFCSLLPSTASAAGDSTVFALIETLRPIGAAVVVDGSGSEWGAIPVLTDPSGDAGGDGSRDIIAASLAPLGDAWLVRIETASAPSTDDLAFWLYVDYRGLERIDLEIGLYLGFPDVLWTYPEGGDATFQNWDETASSIGAVVEARVPLDLLAQVLPAEMAGDLTGPGARPWVRITPFTRDAMGEVADTGPAMASYRLIPTPYDLDGSLPSVGAEPPEPTVEIHLPLGGLQYLGQGAGGIGTHAGIWGYDFFRVDGTLSPSDPPLATQNDDYFSFGETITAPAFGVVFSLENNRPDLPPLADPCVLEPPNFLFLDVGGGVGLLFSHLVQGSIPFAASDPVAAGAPIGRVGHSGSCSWAHLHLGAETIGGSFPSRPIRLLDVEVGLNPTEDDPWRRRLTAWDAREGLLVRAATSCNGRPGFAGLISCDGFEAGVPAPWWRVASGTPPGDP